MLPETFWLLLLFFDFCFHFVPPVPLPDSLDCLIPPIACFWQWDCFCQCTSQNKELFSYLEPRLGVVQVYTSKYTVHALLSAFSGFLKSNSLVHFHNTRQAHHLHLSFYKFIHCQYSLRYRSGYGCMVDRYGTPKCILLQAHYLWKVLKRSRHHICG